MFTSVDISADISVDVFCQALNRFRWHCDRPSWSALRELCTGRSGKTWTHIWQQSTKHRPTYMTTYINICENIMESLPDWCQNDLKDIEARCEVAYSKLSWNLRFMQSRTFCHVFFVGSLPCLFSHFGQDYYAPGQCSRGCWRSATLQRQGERCRWSSQCNTDSAAFRAHMIIVYIVWYSLCKIL